jgi:hypothetical protein
MLRYRLAGALLATVALTVVLSPALASAQGSTDKDCSAANVNKAPATPGKAVTPPITLTADQEANVVNFGSSRGNEYVDVILKASAALSADVTPEQIVVDVPRRLSRQGATLPSATAPKPTVTPPRIARGRTTITFTVCLSGQGLSAGHYTGTISAEGPEGLGPADIAIAANAQNASLFWIVLIASGLAVFVLVLWRGLVGNRTVATSDAAKNLAATTKEAVAGAAEGAPAQVTKEHADDIKTKADATEAAPSGKSIGVSEVLIALLSTGAAVAASYAVFSDNPAWGDDSIKAAGALVGTMFGAAGLRSLIASAAGK